MVSCFGFVHSIRSDLALLDIDIGVEDCQPKLLQVKWLVGYSSAAQDPDPT